MCGSVRVVFKEWRLKYLYAIRKDQVKGELRVKEREEVVNRARVP